MCNWYQLVVNSTKLNGENSMLTTRQLNEGITYNTILITFVFCCGCHQMKYKGLSTNSHLPNIYWMFLVAQLLNPSLKNLNPKYSKKKLENLFLIFAKVVLRYMAYNGLWTPSPPTYCFFVTVFPLALGWRFFNFEQWINWF